MTFGHGIMGCGWCIPTQRWLTDVWLKGEHLTRHTRTTRRFGCLARPSSCRLTSVVLTCVALSGAFARAVLYWRWRPV